MTRKISEEIVDLCREIAKAIIEKEVREEGPFKHLLFKDNIEDQHLMIEFLAAFGSSTVKIINSLEEI